MSSVHRHDFAVADRQELAGYSRFELAGNVTSVRAIDAAHAVRMARRFTVDTDVQSLIGRDRWAVLALDEDGTLDVFVAEQLCCRT